MSAGRVDEQHSGGPLLRAARLAEHADIAPASEHDRRLMTCRKIDPRIGGRWKYLPGRRSRGAGRKAEPLEHTVEGPSRRHAKPWVDQELVVLGKDLHVCARTMTTITLCQLAHGSAVAGIMQQHTARGGPLALYEVDGSELPERVGIQLESECAHGSPVVIRLHRCAAAWGLEPALMLHVQLPDITLASYDGGHQNQASDVAQFFGRHDCQRRSQTQAAQDHARHTGSRPQILCRSLDAVDPCAKALRIFLVALRIARSRIVEAQNGDTAGPRQP